MDVADDLKNTKILQTRSKTSSSNYGDLKKQSGPLYRYSEPGNKYGLRGRVKKSKNP